MSRLNQKRQQFRINIRKQKIEQIFKLRRRQIVLSNIKFQQENCQNFYKKIEQLKLEILGANQIMKQALETYDFQKCLQGLQITLFVLKKYQSNIYYKEFKKISELVIQTQITDNMFKMFQLSIDCQKQEAIIQKIDQYMLKITQSLICSQKYSMQMIKNQRITQHLLFILKNGPINISNSSKIAFILANTLIQNKQLAFEIRRESHFQQIVKRMQSLQYQMTDNFLISALFFMRVLFEQSYELDDIPTTEQSLQFVVRKCLQIIKVAAYQINKGIKQQTVEDASWIFRYIYQKLWINPKFFVKEINLDQLAEWLVIFKNDLQIQGEILKIVEHICYRDTRGNIIRGLVRQGRLVQTIFSTKRNFQSLSIKILSSIASIKCQDDFKRDLWPTVQALMVGIMQNQATFHHIQLVFNWFDSQEFLILRSQDQKIIGCLIDMIEVINPDTLLLLAEFWFCLFEKGYRGSIPQFLRHHTQISYIKDIKDVLQMQKEKAEQNGSTMSMQQVEIFKNLQNLQY